MHFVLQNKKCQFCVFGRVFSEFHFIFILYNGVCCAFRPQVRWWLAINCQVRNAFYNHYWKPWVALLIFQARNGSNRTQTDFRSILVFWLCVFLGNTAIIYTMESNHEVAPDGTWYPTITWKLDDCAMASGGFRLFPTTQVKQTAPTTTKIRTKRSKGKKEALSKTVADFSFTKRRLGFLDSFVRKGENTEGFVQEREAVQMGRFPSALLIIPRTSLFLIFWY